MPKSRVILIEPIGGMNFTPEPAKRGNQAPPYAIETLGGFLKDRGGFDVSLIHQRPVKRKHIEIALDGTPEGEEPINITDEDIAEVIKRQGDCMMVGISAITPLFNRALQIAKKIKEADPEIKIVIGGYHISAMKDKVYLSKKYNAWEEELKKELGDNISLVDFFVIGEGEETILELAKKVEEGQADFSGVEGIIYREDGAVNEFRPRKRMTNKELEVLPEAYRRIVVPVKNNDGVVEGVKEVPSSVDCTQFGSFPSHKEIRGEIQISSCRGCPGNCEFCSSPMVWGEDTGSGRYRTPVKYRDPKSIVTEIKKYHDDPEYRTNFVYFADLTFNENIQHVEDLCLKMIKSGVFSDEDKELVHWFCLARAFDEKEIVSGKAEKVLELMKKSGCSKIGIGIEAFNPIDVVNLKRPTGEADREKLMQEGIKKYTNAVWSLKRSSDLGMFTRGYFVWGRENQDELFEQKARVLLELEIPKQLFSDYELLRQAVEFIFDRQAESSQEGENANTYTATELSDLVAERFGLRDGERERFLEIDHIRVAPETPYPETALGRTAKLKYNDANGEIIDTDKTLDELISEGWDEWEVLDQEAPTIESSVDVGEIVASQKKLVRDFYLSDGYARSAARKIGRFPYLIEAYKDWAEFWRENGIPVEFEKWQRTEKEQAREFKVK
ncbi:MAG: radical SAM protein [Patescibacteria group bacterium]|jgi:radical SAM superfamily enzyme YgiQ (UPF0313 family)